MLNKVLLSEALVFFGGLATVATVIWNISERQHKNKRELELKIAETNGRVDKLSGQFKLFAFTARNKQNENLNRILDIEGHLTNSTGFVKRQASSSDSGADFLKPLDEDI